MSPDIILLVLLGALLHAVWNAMVKAGKDKSLGAAMISAGAGLSAVPFLPFVPLPNIEALPFILATAVLQFLYFQLVAAAYRAGDIGLVYPLMRGVAPLIVAAMSSVVLGEHLHGMALLGVATISAGILTLAFEARHGNRHAILLALANAGVIATYTFVDGVERGFPAMRFPIRCGWHCCRRSCCSHGPFGDADMRRLPPMSAASGSTGFWAAAGRWRLTGWRSGQ